MNPEEKVTEIIPHARRDACDRTHIFQWRGKKIMDKNVLRIIQEMTLLSGRDGIASGTMHLLHCAALPTLRMIACPEECSMAPKKKTVVSKKSKSAASASKPKKKSSGGGGISMGTAITAASLFTVVISGLILWSYNSQPVNQPVAAVVAPPVVQKPKPAPAEQPPVAASALVNAGNPAPAAAASSVPMVPLNQEWLSPNSNVVVHVRLASLQASPLLQTWLQSPEGQQFLQPLKLLSDQGVGAIESVTFSAALDAEQISRWEKFQIDSSGASGTTSIPMPEKWAAVIRLQQDFNSGDDDNTLLEASTLFRRDGDSRALVIHENQLSRIPPQLRHLRFRQADPKVMLAGTPETLAALTDTPASPRKFPGIPANADLVIAFGLDAADLMQNAAPGAVPLDSEQTRQLTDMKAKGVESVSLSASLRDGFTFVSSVYSSKSDAAPAIRQESDKMAEQLRALVTQFRESAPDDAKAVLAEVSQGISVSQSDGVTTFALHISPKAVEFAQTRGPALLMGAMMGGAMPGPGMSPGQIGAIPTGPMDLVTVPLQPAVEVVGLPGGKISAGVNWKKSEAFAGLSLAAPAPALAPSLQLSLAVSDAAVNQIVQYRGLTILEATSATGTPWKIRSPFESTMAGPETWLSSKAVMFAQQGQGVVIPLEFDGAPEAAAGLAKLAGEVELRTAQIRQDQIILATAPGQFSPQQFTELDLRMIPGTGSDAGTIFLIPNSDDTVLLGVEATSSGAVASPGAPQMVQPAPQMEASGDPVPMDDPMPAPDVDGDGQPDSPQRRPANTPVFTLAGGVGALGALQARPIHTYNPRGFQVSVQQANQLTLKLARSMTSHKVSFRFENLAVPAEGGGTSQWVANKDNSRLPEGFTGVFAQALRWDAPEADVRNRRLILRMDLTGPASARVIAHGVDRVTEATFNGTRKLNLDEKGPGFVDRPRGFDAISILKKDPQLPQDTCRVEIPLLSTEAAGGSLTSYVGEFRVRVAASQEDVVVGGLQAFVGKRILHDVFKKEAVNIKLTQDGDKLTVNVPKAERESIAWMELLSDSGAPLPHLPASLSRLKTEDHYVFTLGQGAPALAQLKLRVIVNSGIKLHSIPLAFENIPVPAP